MKRAIHFVGFRGHEYLSALRIWGKPDFVHIGWDYRAFREISDGDAVVFAKGEFYQMPSDRRWNDFNEIGYCP